MATSRSTRRGTTTSEKEADVLCSRCGKTWWSIPESAAGSVLDAHLVMCPVPIAAADLMTAIQNGLYDNAIEALLSSLHTRKRFRRGDTLQAIVGV